ncbi:retrovirus-related Pol polyprotein from transposon TNT 1-94, partial [Trifolium medium]|nr:retrovirus-related Pol polyprotein from transposon TNT 1-94 [Trifolium medium]
HELWDRLFKYFHKQTRARHLRVELRAITLENSSIQDYLLRIRHTVDELTSIGDPLPVSHHIDVILEGLPSDYAPVVSVIESRFDYLDLDEVEVLLLAHELRLNKYKKQTISDVASLNLTHSVPNQAPSTSEAGSSSTAELNSPPSLEPDYNSFRGGKRGGRGGRGGRGRGGRNSDVQCQVCSEWGHSALGCWHRYNHQYQPSNGAASGAHGAPNLPPPHYGASYGYAPPPLGNSYGYPAAHNVWMRPS